MSDISQARPDEWQAAFALAYRRVPAGARELQVAQALQLLETGTLDPAGIWIARRAGRVCGVQVAVPLGGASFLFWLPEASASSETLVALVQAALAWSVQAGARLGQAIVAPADAAHAVPLVRCGFACVTQLLYMERALDPLRCEVTNALRYELFTPATEPCFRDSLARSYVGTLDCPELNGLRSIDEILAGYQAASAGGTAPWWVVRSGDDVIAVAILTELPEGAWDLSYLGVLPEHRGRGIGRRITAHALNTAWTAGARRMLLAVDRRNLPARRLYESLGFIEMDVRDVYLKLLGS
jgi:ribosomal protein S18 acetylase RimI-like enzyme